MESEYAKRAKPIFMMTAKTEGPANFLEIDINRFSSLQKILNVTV